MNVRDRLDPADVERMFDRIAGPYDLMNRVMTAGLDRRWRAIAARESGVGRGATVLDACCGTGDLALELARVVGRSGQVTGLDFSAEMLRRAARKKPRDGRRRRSQWVRGDATAMPFADDSFAAATIAFGLRNLPDPEAGLRELARVVRPGGRVVCLEITRAGARRRSRASTRSGSTAASRRSARSSTAAAPTRTCPPRCAGSPAPTSSARPSIAPA